jgi:hypothetical protein
MPFPLVKTGVKPKLHLDTQALFISRGALESGSHTEHEVAEVQFRQGIVQDVHLLTLLVYEPTGHPSLVG